MRRKLIAGMAVVAFLVSQPAEAQTGHWSYITVDAVEVNWNRLAITGVLNGQASATTETIHFSGTGAGNGPEFEFQIQSCLRLALLALNKPGQFVFEVDRPPVAGSLPKCKLTRTGP
jgi:hypothetical protein